MEGNKTQEYELQENVAKYEKEYNSKWPTNFRLQFSVLARR